MFIHNYEKIIINYDVIFLLHVLGLKKKNSFYSMSQKSVFAHLVCRVPDVNKPDSGTACIFHKT